MNKYIYLLLIFLMSVSSFAQVKVSFKVDGACGMCKERIEGVAMEFDFVKSANWNKEKKLLDLVLNEKKDTDQIQKKIAQAGHDTEKYDAGDEAYTNLPFCCQYRDPDVHDHLHGRVFEKDSDGNQIPLFGASVYWEGTYIGTTADKYGTFLIEKTDRSKLLTLSYAGYESKTVEVNDQDFVVFLFDDKKMLEEVIVTYRKKATTISFLNAIKIQDIGEDELQKAACCTLSESFETNPTVDVSSTDAISGTRQIELLGLAGSYVQITRENMPDTRVLSALYGLSYTPGSWIESIQLNTGAGSVVNGYESVTGQINVELKKPKKKDDVFFNAYANAMGRFEGNLTYSHGLGEKWSTAYMLHGSLNKIRWDNNEDTFLDMPVGDNLIFLNRWAYRGDDNLNAQFGVKATFSNKQGGNKDYDFQNPDNSLWASQNTTDRIEGWAKIGKVFDKTASLGLQMSAIYHRMDSDFGKRQYDAVQKSAYVNSIYQKSLGDRHSIKTGLSLVYDNVEEDVNDDFYLREEIVYGVFGEYTFEYDDKFTALAGLRIDNHNSYGLFLTPRLNLKYSFSPKSVLRASLGRGQKTASIFAENIGAFASSRVFLINGEGNDKPYGLEAEVAWNYGLNFTQEFILNSRSVVFSADYYYTDFENQIVVDYDTNPQELSFYNLDGRSFSHSLQFQGDIELNDHFDLRLAYRYNDVKSTYSGELLKKPLVANHRAFLNMAYNTYNNWSFDATVNWIGSKRLPSTLSNPSEYQMIENSPSYFLVNAQISKTWVENKFDTYIGVENLLNYRQKEAIISADDPHGEYFDASMIWGPVFGRNIYLGLRLNL